MFCTVVHASRAPDTPPPVALLDLKLPKIDGLQVRRGIKTDPRIRSVLVVVLTPRRNSATSGRRTCMARIATSSKPVEYAELITKLGQLLGPAQMRDACNFTVVVPAKGGTQRLYTEETLDSRLRGNDGWG